MSPTRALGGDLCSLLVDLPIDMIPYSEREKME